MVACNMPPDTSARTPPEDQGVEPEFSLDIPEPPRGGDADAAQFIKDAAESKIAELEAQLAEAKDQWIRAVADTQNVRRRAKLDVEEAHKFAVTRFAKDVLSVVDNLGRALQALPPGGEGLDERLKGVVQGVEATQRELNAVLERNGVKKIDAQDKPFDPNLHQAVAQIPDPSRPNNTVAQVYQDGYVIADRLLRAAMVSVATGGPAAAPADDQAPAP
jgi:molecular chaperone GrpE